MCVCVCVCVCVCLEKGLPFRLSGDVNGGYLQVERMGPFLFSLLCISVFPMNLFSLCYPPKILLLKHYKYS